MSDYNDLMDEIIDHREQQIIASISDDSNRASSLSNFGIDIDNPEENARYILQNQNPNAVIQGVGVEDRIVVDKSDSGLATSISMTRNSEFNPVIIEYPKEHSLRTQSLLNGTSECEDTEVIDENSNETDYEVLDVADNLQERELSTFDLALEKGYSDQAKFFYDDVISKGLKLKTKFLQSEEEVLGDNKKYRVTEKDISELGEGFYSKEFLNLQIFMLQKDFKEYLENIKKNEYGKVLKKLKYKQNRLNEIEKQIEKNCSTKEKRKNLKLKGETIKMIEGFIEHLDSFEIQLKGFLKNLHAGKENKRPSEESETHKENGEISLQENKKNDNFDEDGAVALRFCQPSCSKN